jgi:stearoyl-CoA 9-desaturase NADPH oxidoreductase
MTMSTTPTLPPPTWLERLTRPVVRSLQHPVVDNVLRLGAVEDTLRGLHPMWSLTQVRARVLRVHTETADTKTFVLRPNALWRGAQPGQHVQVQVEVNGRRHTRAYSLSRLSANEIAITVKRQPQGLVSGYLHDHVQAGQVLNLSQAEGDFVMPEARPRKILLLSAGSGITPVMALRQHLLDTHYSGDLQFLHISRHAADLIFARQLQGAAEVHHHQSSVDGRFDMQTLQALVPDWAQRATWLCGPSGFMDAVHALWAQHPGAAPLHSERFGAALRPVQALGSPVQVQLQRSGAQFSTAGAAPLLQQAEATGLAPKHGCRIGICRACQCTKRSGTVQNLQTGELCSLPDQPIRLCISAARTDLTLDL